ncbi:hypothetical protein PsYK624_141580 [Phanerochaete sordida]|uniref:Uncharacterized protein n=1 Tax=Phanerochaete sordida TaxID=48140 RepID=A0A9P3GNE9_9APHY|nr:hypothetical protein PsYK624_141580 [Phanerochaete sordida]
MQPGTSHDMPFIRIVGRPEITDELQAEFQLMQHCYARQDPSIRYRGFEMSLRANTPKPAVPASDRLRGIWIGAPTTVDDLVTSSLLLPLDVARQCKHITHRREGFEIKEAVQVSSFEVVRRGWF